MRQETQGRISKGELPILLPGSDCWGETRETVLGMLVRALRRSELVRDVILLTSDTWVAPHTELARELARRYDMEVQCKSDGSNGDEFTPLGVVSLTQQISRLAELGTCTILMNGDILVTPRALCAIVDRIRESRPPIALGCSEVSAEGLGQYLGIYFLSAEVDWDRLFQEIAARSIIELIQGISQRIPIVPMQIDGPIYDCGSVEGYRKAYEDGRAGKLW